MTETSDYERGHKQGGVEEQISEHGRRLDKINGTIVDFTRALNEQKVDITKAMGRLELAIQRLGDQAEANAATAIVTARALKDAEEARRAKAEQSWTPIGKMIAALGAVAAIATVVGLYLALVHH